MNSLIFVSHAAVDQEVATKFKEEITHDFLGLCDVFVSSNLDSISAGAEWHQVIKERLLKADIVIGLLSPVAITRGWIYAEFGAGWIRGIPTIPVCHSGLDRSALPPPISAFQALNLWEPDHIDHLYRQISEAVGCKTPKIDFAQRAQMYQALTERIRLQRVILSWMHQLIDWNPLFFDELEKTGSYNDLLVPANLDQPFQEFVSEARKRNLLDISRAGMAMGTRIGPQASVFSVIRGKDFEYLRKEITNT